MNEKTADFKQKAARRKRLQGQAEKGKVLAVYVRLLRMSGLWFWHIMPERDLVIFAAAIAVAAKNCGSMRGYKSVS